MHDTDNDGTITLEEYRHVSLEMTQKTYKTQPIIQKDCFCLKSDVLVQQLLQCVQVVEELLSRSGALGKETAKSIADAAMLEVASVSVGHMVL